MVIDSLEPVEDTKGNNGESGTLQVTNLRMIWMATENFRTNLSVGYGSVVNIHIRAAQSRLKGNTEALYVLTKFNGSRFEFIFTNLVRDSPRLFTTVQAVFRSRKAPSPALLSASRPPSHKCNACARTDSFPFATVLLVLAWRDPHPWCSRTIPSPRALIVDIQPDALTRSCVALRIYARKFAHARTTKRVQSVRHIQDVPRSEVARGCYQRQRASHPAGRKTL